MYSYYIVLRSVWSIFNFLLHLHIFFLFLYIFSCFYLTWHTSIFRKVNINCLYVYIFFQLFVLYVTLSLFFIGIYLYFTFSSHFHFIFVLFLIFCYILLILYLIAILFDFKLFQRWFISSKRRCNITASSWEVSEPKSLRPVPSRRS